jgi:hypothetical protein
VCADLQGISTGGLQLDFLPENKCYRSFIRISQFSRDVIPIRWYRCAANALPFPGFHSFCSSVYDDTNEDRPDPPIGEQRHLGLRHCELEDYPYETTNVPSPSLEWFRTGFPAGAYIPGSLEAPTLWLPQNYCNDDER